MGRAERSWCGDEVVVSHGESAISDMDGPVGGEVSAAIL